MSTKYEQTTNHKMYAVDHKTYYQTSILPNIVNLHVWSVDKAYVFSPLPIAIIENPFF